MFNDYMLKQMTNIMNILNEENRLYYEDNVYIQWSEHKEQAEIFEENL